jgi:hypothetical protein
MNTTEVATYTVAASSTGMLHRAYSRGEGNRTVRTAECATDYRVGGRAVYLRDAREVAVGARPEGRLCGKCFPVEREGGK